MAITLESLASSSAGCAYRVSCPGSRPLLIECGLPFGMLQKALDFQVSKLAGCLVSHSHADHSKAVHDLCKAGIDCWMSEPCLNALYTDKSGHRLRCLIPESDQRDPIHVDDWSVSPFHAVHDCPGTLGFVVDSPAGDRLLYLTDSAYSKFTFSGLTHIAVECNHSVEMMRANAERGDMDRERFARVCATHMSIERLEDMLRANDLSRCREIHLLHLSDGNSDAADFKARIEKLTGIPVTVAAK